jgi:hypothetical protein
MIKSGDVVNLKLGIGPSSGLVQLFESYDPDKMYKKYWYKSTINELMRKQLKDIVTKACDLVKLNWGDIVLDIASNDGEMLTNYSRDLIRVGVDPSDVALKSSIYHDNDIHLINNYFGAYSYLEEFGLAKVITCAAMFYDLDRPLDFLWDVEKCMTDDGIFIVQLSYLPLILNQMSFDGIGEEHLCYYSLTSFKYLLNLTNLEIFDVEINDVNSGSIRIYITKKSNMENINNALHTTLVREMRIKSLLQLENISSLNKISTYQRFKKDIDSVKEELISTLKKIKSEGKSIYGIGASTKGNTILQYCGIGPELIDAIGERNSDKFGLYTIGTGIPIIDECDMRNSKPDYLLVLPYTFVTAFMLREKELRDSDTRFIVPLPEVRII